MLTRKRRQAVWLFAVACVVLIFGIVLWVSSGAPTSAEICNKSNETGEEQCASYHIALVTIWHIAKFFDDHHGLVTALATIAIGAFTFTLWRSTRELWTVTKIAAEYIPAVEGAYVYVLLKKETLDEDFQMIETGKIRPDFMIEIRVSLKNFGKTPAVIERFSAILSYVSGASTKHGTEATIQPNTIIGTSDEVPANFLKITAPLLSQSEATHIRKHEASLLLKGTLVYSDIWGDKWTIIFDGRNGDTENQGFRLDNYPRKKQT
jgi:hypothetical protein